MDTCVLVLDYREGELTSLIDHKARYMLLLIPENLSQKNTQKVSQYNTFLTLTVKQLHRLDLHTETH